MHQQHVAVALTADVSLAALAQQDAEALAEYFEGLSAETRSRFQPHPLTRKAAVGACGAAESLVGRFVLWKDDVIIGYFILERRMSIHEASRYAKFGLILESGKDLLFAPSIIDEYQSTGLASLAMPHLIEAARRGGARSLVLMGGTQASNTRAIGFYEKFGFKRFGGYWTGIFNHDMRLIVND